MKYLVKDSRTLAQYRSFQEKGFDPHGHYMATDSVMGFDPKNLGMLFAAQDAVSSGTVANTGVPAEFLTYFDPRIVEVVFGPCRAEEIGQLRVVGDWTTVDYKYTVAEISGKIRPYSDFSQDPNVDLNTNYEIAKVFAFESIILYGDKEVAQNSKTFVDWVTQKRIGVATTFNVYFNSIFFNGVEELNYGIINSPNRNASIPPATVRTNVTQWQDKTGIEIIADIITLQNQLINQSQQIITGEEPMTMVMSTDILNLLKGKVPEQAVTFGSVYDWLRANYPKIKFIGVPQYNTASGNLVDLFLDEYAGQKCIELIVTEKYRSHGVVKMTSAQKEKISGATAGAIIARPWMLASMIGV